MPKELIEELEELRLMLEKAQTERYVWFLHNSEAKEKCGYAMKAKELFEHFHSEDIEKKITDICDSFYRR